VHAQMFPDFSSLPAFQPVWSNLIGPCTGTTYPNGTVYVYFLSATLHTFGEAPVLMSGYRVDANGSTAGEALLMRTYPLISNPERRDLFGGSINSKHFRNPITESLIVSASNAFESVYRNETPVAHECVLSWCVQIIKSSYF
jgi:hypothetical protein